MADPDKYVPSYSFSGFQASNPTTPLPAASVDAELADVSDSIDQIVDAIADVRRSDGALKNGIVTTESLSADVLAAMGDPIGIATQVQAEAGSSNEVLMTPLRVEQRINIMTSSDITNFTEAVQDVVGGYFSDSSTVDVTYNDGSNTLNASVIDGSISNAKVASGIDAAKIGNGDVSNTEFGYLNGVDSALQTQIDTLLGPAQWAGRYITGVFTNPASTATGTVSANLLYAVPFLCQANATFTSLSIDVTVADVGKSCRLGVIAAGADGKPGDTVLLDAGTVSVGTTGIKTTSTFSLPVRAGDFFYVVLVSDGAPTLRLGVPGLQFSHFMGVATLGTQDSCIYKSFTYGALSGAVPFGTPSIVSANVPIIAFKI